MKRCLAIAFCFSLSVLIGLPSALLAVETEGSISMSHMGGYYMFEDDQPRDDGATYQFGLGYNFTDNFGAEFGFNFVDSEFDEDAEGLDLDDEEAYLFHLDALYHLMPQNRLVPYLVTGVGSTNVNDFSGNTYNPTFNAGGGVKFDITRRIKLRGDVRYFFAFNEPDNNIAATAGLTFVLGARKISAGPEEPRVKDSDGDGVPDADDLCPDTPPDTPVNEVGCPDTDGDGVYDNEDQCPNTPMGTPVDEVGCPIEAEVTPEPEPVVEPEPEPEPEPEKPVTPLPPSEVEPEPMEEPTEPEVEPTEEEPTPVPVVTPVETDEGDIELEVVIQFEFDKSYIRPMYHDPLAEIAELMSLHPDTIALIEGHTCNIGTDQYNMGLSRRRAESVRDYLVDNFEIMEDRFDLRWFGESRPAYSNLTAEGRRKNRRSIIIKLIRP